MSGHLIVDHKPEIWETEKLNDRAYNQIKSMIVSRELAPGTRLVDSQIADKYGISRTPVRDAIRKLVEEGLVTSNSKKGFFVFKPTLQDIIEIYEVRLIIDKAVVTKIIKEILPANYQLHIQTVDQIARRLEEDHRDRQNFIASDEAFHSALVKFSSNSRIISIYNENSTQMRGFRFQTSIKLDRLENAHRLHCALLAAIRSMDLEAALLSIEEHVATSRTDALADFGQD